MTVWQLPCDKFVVLFAREMYILNLRSPGVTNRSEMKVNQIGSEQTVSRDSFNYAREVKAADMSNLQVVIYWVS